MDLIDLTPVSSPEDQANDNESDLPPISVCTPTR